MFGLKFDIINLFITINQKFHKVNPLSQKYKIVVHKYTIFLKEELSYI